MRKLIMVFALAGALMADGYFVGADAGYGSASSDVSGLDKNVRYDYVQTTKSKSLTLKAGYGSKDFRFFGYLSGDKFDDNTVTGNDGRAEALGAEFDVMFNKAYIGVLAGFGAKDFNGDSNNFVQYGVKVGYLADITKDVELEVGVMYKIQDYNDRSSDSGDGINATYDGAGNILTPYVPNTWISSRHIKDETVSVFIGVNFNGL